MRRRSYNFTLQSLMTFVFVASIALAFLHYGLSDWGLSDGGPNKLTICVLFLLLILLFVMNVRICCQVPRGQMFRAGFGVFGWTYLALSLGTPMGQYLPTTQLLIGLGKSIYFEFPLPRDADTEQLNRRFRDPHENDDLVIILPEDYVSVDPDEVSPESFIRMGHLAITLAFSLLGGFAASVLFPEKPCNRKNPDHPSSPDMERSDRRVAEPSSAQ